MAKDLTLANYKDILGVMNNKYEAEEKNINIRREYYRGNQWHPRKDGEGSKASRFNDYITDNVVFPNIKAIMASINLQNPKIFVKAKKKPYRVNNTQVFDTLSASIIVEMLINYYYRELKVKREMDKVLLDALIGPWGIMEVGYTLETEKIKGDNLLITNELIKSESIYAVRRSPKDFRNDVEGKQHDLTDSNMIALRWVKTIDDIKDSSFYENTRGLKANFQVKTDFSGSKEPDRRALEEGNIWERVEGWDIWDKKNKRLISVVEDHDKFLHNSKWPLNLEGFPVETLYFNENPDEAFPIGDIDIYRPTQDEINVIASMQVEHINRISRRKYATTENNMEAEEIEKLIHGPEGTVVIAQNPDKLVPLRDAVISQDISIVRRDLKQNINQMSGVSDFENAISRKFETATEPSLIAQSTRVKRQERITVFEDFIKRVVAKMTCVLQQTMNPTSVPLSDEQFEQAQMQLPKDENDHARLLDKIVGPENTMIIMPWLNLSKDDIAGEYEFDIEVGSTQPVNQQQRRQDAIQLSKVLQNNPYIDPYEATKKILEAFDVVETSKLMKDPQVVMQEQQQQMQMRMQQALAETQLKSERDIQKTQMKTESSEKQTAMKVQADMVKDSKKVQSNIFNALVKNRQGGE